MTSITVEFTDEDNDVKVQMVNNHLVVPMIPALKLLLDPKQHKFFIDVSIADQLKQYLSITLCMHMTMSAGDDKRLTW